MKRRRGGTAVLGLAGLLALTISAFLAMTAGSASAAVIHPYQSQITEAGGSALGEPLGLAVDSTGNLYVSDGNEAAPALDKFDSTNAPVTAWGTNGQITAPNGEALVKPFGLTVDASDNLWAMDPRAGSVIELEPTGSFARKSSAEGRISSFAQSVAYSTAAERIFVMDSGSGELLALKPDGTFESTVANFGTCCFFNVGPDNSAGATGGDLYVSGEGNAVFRIHGSGPEAGEPDEFSASASYIEGAKLTGGPSGPFGAAGQGRGVKGLAVDSEGNLFVAAENGVFEFAPSGKALGRITGTATGPGGSLVPFGEVTSVGVGAASGKLYVGDSANHVVDVFGPGLPVPDAITKPATNITTTSATLNGEVNPAGLAVEECLFEYGTSTAYGQLAPCEAPDAAELGSGTSPVAVHADVNLPSGKTIHFRVAAKNENGTNDESGDQEFLTGASIDFTSASEVTADSATLETELNPHGLPTTYRFEYDTVPYVEGGPAHGTSTPTGSAGSGTTDVIRTAQIQGLAPLTTYHYRVVATNSLGTSEGEDRTFTTQGAPAALLPDDRAYEMVTPPNKFGSPLESITEEGGTIQAAADGSAFADVALGPLGPQAKGVRSPSESQWLSNQAPAGGWSTADISTPHEEISTIRVGFPSEYRAFSNDLRSGIVEPEGATRLDPTNPANTERTPYLRQADGAFVPLVNADNVPLGTHFGGIEVEGSGQWQKGVEYVTATSDLSHVILRSPALLTDEFEPGFEPNGRRNLYELFQGRLTLVSVLPDQQAASEAGIGVDVGQQSLNMRGALSSDGNRLVFEAEPGLDLRDIARAQTIRLDVPQAGAAGGSGAPRFQIASEDGRRVFFTDASRLTADSTAQPGKPDLYMCEVEIGPGQLACAITDLSVDPNPDEAASVQGRVSAIDASGTHVYFVADGILTTAPNVRGELAEPGECESAVEAACNLYEYDTSSQQISLVAVLSSHDDPDWDGHTNAFEVGNLTARSSPDGRYFTFMSQRSLTGYNNRDAASGQPDAEVFQLDTRSDELRCLSCDPTGARPQGMFDPSRVVFPGPLVDHAHSWGERWVAGSVPGWTQRSIQIATYQSRYLADSGREFFNAADALVPADTNGVNDVYQYEPPGVGDCTTSSPTYGTTSGGCVSLISSGTSPEESAFLDASESGNDVFFLTASQLARKDTDTALDVYDASVNGGEPEEASPPACEGDACQQPATPPNDATPGSLTFNGAGNVLQCPKGKVKKSGHCVKRKKAKHHKKHKAKKRHARSNKRAGH